MKSELEKAKQARRVLGKVRLKLLTPTVRSLDSSASDLAVAIDCLKGLEADFTSGQRHPPGWRRAMELEIGGLRTDLREVNALMAGAAKFYEGWARLVSSGADDGPANYTARGMPSSPVPSRSDKVVAIG